MNFDALKLGNVRSVCTLYNERETDRSNAMAIIALIGIVQFFPTRHVNIKSLFLIPGFFLHNYVLKVLIESAAYVKMEIPVLVRSLKSSILSSTSFQMGKTFWGVVSAAVEQSRRKASKVAQGDGKFCP